MLHTRGAVMRTFALEESLAKNRMSILAATLSALLGVAVPAGAQAVTTTVAAPIFEFSAGYQFLNVSGQNTSDSYPMGFALDGAKYRGAFGIVGEFGLSRDSADVPGVSVRSSFLHIGGGPRLLFVRESAVRPYVQVLGGVSRAKFTTEIDTAGVVQEQEVSDTAFMVQPGAGLTFVMGNAWGLFGSVDYRRSFFDEGPGLGYSNTNEVRVFIGARMIFG